MASNSRIYQDISAALPTLSKAVFSQSVNRLSPAKVQIRPLRMKGGIFYQVESFADNKAFHKNLTADELLYHVERELDGAYRQVLIVCADFSAQYSLNAKGGYKKKTLASLPVPGGIASHNREKSYILSEGETIPALVDMGVFTPDFKIIRSKYDKFRQINRFVELIDHEFAESGRDEITILDFGCGKSYLTFVLYYYFTVKKGMKAKIIGYDLKADVVEHCNQVAEKYGYHDLRFVHADVTKDVLYQEKIDMIVTLHACDTATDYALHYALEKKAEYIFSVPCCQHEINSTIRKGGELDVFLSHGIIKERMSALLTDSIRAGILEDMGYRVDMIEFVDFEHSPKNIMIRARRCGKRSDKNILRAKELVERYGFEHSLLRLVAKDG